MVRAERPGVTKPLADSLASLAGTPDDAPRVKSLLETIAQLTVDRVAAVNYASVTAMADARYTTVAASSDIARAVDEAQYEAQDGPCIQALETQTPAAVPDTSTTIYWPEFATVARRYGLSATMSAPLYVGSGACAAVLNMYGCELAAMAPLICGVWSIYRPDRHIELPAAPPRSLDPGGLELVAGLTRALAVRDVIQSAIHVVRARAGCTDQAAYQHLVQRSTETGMSLAHTAARELTSGM
jgi:hypothetical protein